MPASVKQVAGIIGVVGRTNAGKSTLVNRIIGEKVSIVSPVVQTTRAVIRGVLTDERGQLVLLDTPGLHKSRNLLTTTMNKRARAAADGVDALLLVVDGSQSPQLEDEGWMRRLTRASVPLIIALNKSDKASKAAEFKAMWEKVGAEEAEANAKAEAKSAEKANAKAEAKDAENAGARDAEKSARKHAAASAAARNAAAPSAPLWFAISAATGSGVDSLAEKLFALLPAGEPLFDEETLSDYPRKLAVADVIRECFFLSLKDELPHSIGVIVESIKDDEGAAKAEVEAQILVKRQSHKGIVIGSGGRGIKGFQNKSGKELSDFFGKPVSVALRVKVEPGWDENQLILRKMGYL